MKKSEFKQLIKEKVDKTLNEGFFTKKDTYDSNPYMQKSKTPDSESGVYSSAFKKELLNLTYKHMKMFDGMLDPEDAAGVVDTMLQSLVNNFK